MTFLLSEINLESSTFSLGQIVYKNPKGTGVSTALLHNGNKLRVVFPAIAYSFLREYGHKVHLTITPDVAAQFTELYLKIQSDLNLNIRPLVYENMYTGKDTISVKLIASKSGEFYTGVYNSEGEEYTEEWPYVISGYFDVSIDGIWNDSTKEVKSITISLVEVLVREEIPFENTSKILRFLEKKNQTNLDDLW